VYQTEKNLKEYKDRIDASDVSRLESDVEAVKSALKSGVAADIKSSSERLNATWQQVSQRMYQQASSAGDQGAQSQPRTDQSAAEGGAGAGPGGAVDAEYEVIDGEGKKKK
jgi:molecular chaperone DnaK